MTRGRRSWQAKQVTQRPDHVGVEQDPERYGLRLHEGELSMEGVALSRIAAEQGTPTYVYAASVIEGRLEALREAVGQRPTTICYAVKANSALAVLSLLGRRGAGADIVSGGELRRALRAGIPAERIVL